MERPQTWVLQMSRSLLSSNQWRTTACGRKIHIGIDEKSLEILAAEFTTSDVGDAPMLFELLDQIPPGQESDSITADGAFVTRKCHDAIAARGVAAIIPPARTPNPGSPILAVRSRAGSAGTERFGRIRRAYAAPP